MSDVFRKYGIFLLIPGIVLGFSVLLKLAAGPFWLATNFDPSYQYLVNGVYLVKGLVPNHADHPGTPLQILCWVVGWLFNIGRSPENVATHILMSPEFYLHVVFIIVSLFSFITSFGLASYVFQKTGDTIAALLTQLPALIFLVMKSWETVEPVLPVVANVEPEPLLISIVNLFNICLLMAFFSRTPKDESVATLLWGGISGLGVAVKLTFAPLVIVPLIILSWRNKVIFVCLFVASFVLCTLPIYSKYPIIWGWISGVIMPTGGNRPGGRGIIGCFILAALALVFWKFFRGRWDRGISFITATLGGILLQFGAVTRHPGAHYLLPGIGLLSVLLALCYLQGAARHHLGQRLVFIFICVFIIAGAWQANDYRLKLEGLTQDILAFHDHISTRYQKDIIIDYYRSSDQQAALFFGDGWNLSPHLGKELFGLYPDKFYYNIWGNRILNFNDRVWSNDLLAQGPYVLFRGDGNFNFSDGPYKVELLEKGRFESIHILTGSTEKQAAIFLSGAMQLMQAGDYTKARLCLLQARHFHYQPDSSVESLMQLLGANGQH